MEPTFCSGYSPSSFEELIVELGLARGLVLCLLGSSESSRPLLVHLCSRRNTVNSQVNDFLRLANAHDFVSISENVLKDFEFALRLGSILRMSTRVNNAVHVKIQIVDFRCVLLDALL